MRVYSLYLSTLSTGKFAPINKTNSAQVKWCINFREIFGNRSGECRVRARFLSSSANTLTWTNNTGSIRLSFQSNTSNSTNGFNIGSVRPQSDYTSGTANTTYLDLDSTTSNGVTMLIPNTNGDFTVTLLNNAENVMVNVPEYQIWLWFDVDDENPLTLNDGGSNYPIIYNPR